MHVQGLSHWAPANIGPYSQAVMVTTAEDFQIHNHIVVILLSFICFKNSITSVQRSDHMKLVSLCYVVKY